MKSEFARIAKLTELFAREKAGVIRAIGDDAAVLEAPGAEQIVWTVDAQVEGVHFRSDLVSWHDEGFRSFMAAASDLAAMGATPWCALSSLVLPRAFADDAFEAIAAGQAEAASALGAPIVGGNLARGDAVSITTTLLGRCAHATERRAHAGDGIWIAGPVGLAAAGLALLDRKIDDPLVKPAVLAWRRPRARIAEGLAMAKVARGAIDVSDGLAQDIAHVARASHVRAILEEAALREYVRDSLEPISPLVGRDALDLALHGGEDYAIVAASPVPIDGFARIGAFEARAAPDDAPLVWLATARGRTPIAARGFDHFR